MRILGLDASKNACVGFTLETLPTSVKREYERAKSAKAFHVLKAGKDGLELLRQLKPDIMALEPTGIHYTEFWRIAGEHLGIKILWVGHIEIANYRKHHKLSSKSDRADAYAIACYTLANLDNSEYFLNYNPAAREIRALVLQHKSLGNIEKALICRTKQQLAHEWPEVAGLRSEVQEGRTSPLYRHIAGLEAQMYPGLAENSVARDLGLELSKFTVDNAGFILQIQKRRLGIQSELERLTEQEEFQPYLKPMKELGMGILTRATILSKIYPLEKFRYQNCQGKTCWASKSFRMALGIGKVWYQSGDFEGWVWGGSAQARDLIALWVSNRIAIKVDTRRRPKTALAKVVCDYYDSLKKTDIDTKLLNKKVASKAVRLLFSEMINGLGQKVP